MSHVLQNNFNKLKDQFRKDTGLEWNKELDKYIAYYQAYATDQQAQYTGIIAQEIASLKGLIPFIKK